MSRLRQGSGYGGGRFGRAALVAACVVASTSGTASAAVQQDLRSFHLGFKLGVAPQLDSSGNLLTLMDFGDGTHLVKFNPAGGTVWSVLLPQPFLNSGCH